MEFVKADNTDYKHRAIKLEDGMIFTIYEKYTLMYEDSLCHEVKFKGYEIDPCINPTWEKIGKSYTIEEVSKLKGDE